MKSKKLWKKDIKSFSCLFRRVANTEECIRYVRKEFLLKSVDVNSLYMLN